MDADEMSRLRRAVSRLARSLNTAATGESLTPTQSSVLALVCRSGALPLAEITRAEGLNPTMTSRVTSRLVDKGLIERVPGRDDRRTASVEATDAGETVHERIRDRRNALFTDRLGRLAPDELRRLHDALPALESLMDAADVASV